MLFTERSLWTMVHGVGLGGATLLGLAAALFFLRATQPLELGVAMQRQARYFNWLAMFVAVAAWLTVIVGTYVSFPEYRASPPEGAIDLSRYPRSLIQSNPGTAWLHSFAMETKEHVPWIAAMLTAAVAFTTHRYRTRLLSDMPLRRVAMSVLAISFILVAGVALLGTFINKVAPLE